METDLRLGDCVKLLKKVPAASVHAGITDPPYGMAKMGADWNAAKLAADIAKSTGVKGGLPGGQSYDDQHGIDLAKLMLDVSKQMHRVLKPGSFYLAFSNRSAYDFAAQAIRQSGFEIRDMLLWAYRGQPSAQSQNFRVEKMDLPADEKTALLESLGVRKTAMLAPMGEPIAMAQKPKEGTYVQNWIAHEVGLVDTTQSLDGKFPGTVMEVPKPPKAERALHKQHPTAKPLALMEHLVRLFTKEGQTILDPFLGSGTTGVAAVLNCRDFIGFEREPKYFENATTWIDEAKLMPQSVPNFRYEAKDIKKPRQGQTPAAEFALSDDDANMLAELGLQRITSDYQLGENDEILIIAMKPALPPVEGFEIALSDELIVTEDRDPTIVSPRRSLRPDVAEWLIENAPGWRLRGDAVVIQDQLQAIKFKLMFT